MRSFLSPALAAAAIFANTASALVGYCPVDGQICAQIGVPPNSAQAGSGNLYFQIQALDSYAWVSIGTGTSMSNSNMFVMYQNGAGNVTISARTAKGHNMPTSQTQTQLELLAGSGVEGGIMKANVLCKNCESWGSGNMQLSGASTPWIGAWRSGNSLNSASVSANIAQHNAHDSWNFDLSKAVLTADANPFIDGGASSTNDGNNSNDNNGANSGLNGGNNGATSTKTSTVNLFLIHGIVMTVVFVFMFPMGSILMPLIGKWFVHAGFQMLGFVGMWVGFGIGYAQSNKGGVLFKSSHTIFGTIICCALIVQPALGFLHHRYYVKHQARGAISYAHIWYGRVWMLLGIVNGGLGLQLSGASNNFVLAYAILSSIFGVAYIASTIMGAKRRPRREKDSFVSPQQSPPMGFREGGRQQAYVPRGQAPPQTRYQRDEYSRERYQ